jgi:nonspecific dipeptidase
VIFATFGSDPKKKTVLIYGHLDVQPAKKEDGWDTEPFKLTDIDGKLYGRGATDDKGPVLGWIHAIEAYQEQKVEIPVNIKFVLEAMEESGSEGLERLLNNEKNAFLKGVDMVCISDNYWLGKTKPCLLMVFEDFAIFTLRSNVEPRIYTVEYSEGLCEKQCPI